MQQKTLLATTMVSLQMAKCEESVIIEIEMILWPKFRTDSAAALGFQGQSCCRSEL